MYCLPFSVCLVLFWFVCIYCFFKDERERKDCGLGGWESGKGLERVEERETN